MVQVTIKFDEKDRDEVFEVLSTLPDYLSLNIDHSQSNTLIIKGMGYLHVEVEVCQLRNSMPGITLHVSKPEVIFQQPMMQVIVTTPKCFRVDVGSELYGRHPDRPMQHQWFGECLNQPDDEKYVFEGRFPLYMLNGLVERLRLIGSDHIRTLMTPDGTSNITESQLRDQLN